MARTACILTSLFAGLLLLPGCPGDDDSKDPAPEEVTVLDGTADIGLQLEDVGRQTEDIRPEEVVPDIPAPDEMAAPEVVDVVTPDETICVPECEEKECGEDGCGGQCGACEGAQEVCNQGLCLCVVACDGKECGDDGCGGQCGECHEFAECFEGECLCPSECAPPGTTKCIGDEIWVCTQVSDDPPCNQWTLSEPCLLPKKCVAGECVETCAPDNCGGCCAEGICMAGTEIAACGAAGTECLTCPETHECLAGTCFCEPNCEGKACGSDGCGSTCGTCEEGLECQMELCVPAFCEPRDAMIMFNGLEANGGGFAGWNANGAGPEEAATGHAVDWAPVCSGANSYYYAATRDFIDPDSGTGLTGVLVMDGFPLLSKVLADNGLTAGDITITQSLMDMGDDIKAQDWWYDPFTTNESRNYYGSQIILWLDGEAMVKTTPDKTVVIASYNVLDNCFDDEISGLTDYAMPLDNSVLSSPVVQAAAMAFIADVGAFGFTLFYSGLQPIGQADFDEEGRDGAFFDVQQGILGLGEEPMEVAECN